MLLTGTRETIALTEKMASVGASAVLVTTPCFYKNRMNVKAMNKHYTEVGSFRYKTKICVIGFNKFHDE